MDKVFNVIIADSSKLFVDILKGYIENDKRFNVIGIAEDEFEEISMIDKYKPDLVITNLRKKQGWIGLDIIKSYDDKDFKPIFFVISGSVYEFINEILELNIKYFLNKPFLKKDLFEILDIIYNENK